jgi:hypothetical protein
MIKTLLVGLLALLSAGAHAGEKVYPTSLENVLKLVSQVRNSQGGLTLYDGAGDAVTPDRFVELGKQASEVTVHVEYDAKLVPVKLQAALRGGADHPVPVSREEMAKIPEAAEVLAVHDAQQCFILDALGWNISAAEFKRQKAKRKDVKIRALVSSDVSKESLTVQIKN